MKREECGNDGKPGFPYTPFASGIFQGGRQFSGFRQTFSRRDQNVPQRGVFRPEMIHRSRWDSDGNSAHFERARPAGKQHQISVKTRPHSRNQQEEKPLKGSFQAEPAIKMPRRFGLRQSIFANNPWIPEIRFRYPIGGPFFMDTSL